MREWNDQVPIDELCVISKHNFVGKFSNTKFNGSVFAQYRKRELVTQAKLHMYFFAPCLRICGLACAYAMAPSPPSQSSVRMSKETRGRSRLERRGD